MTQDETLDLAADVAPLPSDTELTRVATAAQRILAYRNDVKLLEAQLTERKAALRQLEDVELPDLMDAVGLDRVTLTSGEEVTVRTVVAGSITEKRRAEALEWLRTHGHGSMISMTHTISLPSRTPPERVAAVAATLEALDVELQTKEQVHHATLSSWAKEMLAEGEELPLDLLGIYVGRRATVK